MAILEEMFERLEGDLSHNDELALRSAAVKAAVGGYRIGVANVTSIRGPGSTARTNGFPGLGCPGRARWALSLARGPVR
jgi:hypothetical protein